MENFAPVPFSTDPAELRFAKKATWLAVKLCLACVVIQIAAYVSNPFGFLLGAGLLGVMCFVAFQKPDLAFFGMFGAKVTIDTFWWIEPIASPLSLNEFSFMPIAICLIAGLSRRPASGGWVTILVIAYTSWVVAVQFVVDADYNFPLMVRIVGPAIGLLVGMSFLRSRNDLTLMFRVLVISSVVPVLASVSQILLSHFGTTIFFYKTDSVRGIRFSGLYYDPATLGMVMIITILSRVYLLWRDAVRGNWRRAVYLILGAGYLVTIVGATRSVVGISTAVIAGYMLVKFSAGIRLAPVLIVVVLLGQPYIQKIQDRNLAELSRTSVSLSDIQLNKVLSDAKYRQLFTGRMSLWQNAMRLHWRGSWEDQLLGFGRAANFHSSYFYLLLYSGMIGLSLYLIFHVVLLSNLWAVRVDKDIKLVAIFAVLAVLGMGIAATVVLYTSLQWTVYLLAGGALEMGRSGRVLVSRA